MDKLPIALASGSFLFVFARTMYALGAGKHRRSPATFALMCAGFLLQTLHLYGRGQAEGRCPLGTLPDMLVFLAWSMVLLYLVIGTTYRMSLLGAFTAPLVILLQIVASVLPLPDRASVRPSPGPFVEVHAAVTVISYGAFALACVAGVMFLLQERQIKERALHPLFYHLPPINEMAVAIRRLILAGLILLSAGLVSGFMAGWPPAKVAAGLGMWMIYGVLWLAMRLRRLSARRVAWLAVAAFGLALLSLFAIGIFGSKPH